MKNIDFLMNMTRDLISGKLDCLGYMLDFPYEVIRRYEAAARENREYADLIDDLLVENGVYVCQDKNLSDEKSIKLIARQYKEVVSIVKSGFI